MSALNTTLEDALVEAIWAAHMACYEANARWGTPGSARAYDEANARRLRLVAALADGDVDLEYWVNDHIFDLTDEGPAWLGQMVRNHRAYLAQDRVETAMCILADARRR